MYSYSMNEIDWIQMFVVFSYLPIQTKFEVQGQFTQTVNIEILNLAG